MIARLRQLAARPLTGSLRTFATVAAVLVLVAAGLLLTSPEPRPSLPPTVSMTRRLGDAQIAPATPTQAQRVSPGQVQRVARRFLTSYLRFLYGHSDAAQLHAATDALRHRLGEHPPRISPAARRRHPRILRVAVASGDRLIATIADGGVRFPIGVTLTRRPNGNVLVNDVLEDQ